MNQKSTVSSFDLETIEGRERLTTVMRIWTIFCLTFSWTAFKGIGTLVGAIWATYDSFINGQKYAILALPLLHAFAVWNILERLDQVGTVQDILVGAVLILSGILMTLIASKTEIAWNWKIFNWQDEIEYYGWIDRIGLLGIAYFLSGISWAIGEAEQDTMLWAIWATFLSGIAVQGFRDETETPWRRGVGSMGSIFSLFMMSLTFETDLYTNVTWMFLGVVALGFGFAYISRMGEISTVFDEGYSQAKDAITQALDQGNRNIPEAVLDESDLEDEEEIEEVEEVEDEEDDIIDIDEIEDEEDEIEDEEDIIDLDEIDEEKYVNEIPAPVLDTSDFDYDLLLDPSVTAAIQNSLASTPHDGFKPVVSIAPNGNLKIDFVEI